MIQRVSLQLSQSVLISEPGGIPLPIFSEWWLAKEKFSTIEAFIISLFPGATCQGCNGLSIKYQAALRDTKQTKDGVDKEIVSLRSELKKVKIEATAAVDQLQGTKSEVRGLRSMTQRMVLTQSEMLCTCIVAWNLILSYFLYILIAAAYHIAGGSCS